MKELSIEEKAKAYDEAKLRISAAYNSNRCTIGFMNEIFPELKDGKENEDENIREQIVYAINQLHVCECTKNKLLTWLEKQGKNNMGISEATKQKLEDNLNKALEKETPESWNEFLDEQSEQDNDEDSNILQRFSFYSYKDEPNILYLSGLYVNEEHRNKGIGTKILKVVDEVATSMKCNSIRLKTKKDSHAEKLYRKNGYTTILGEEENQIWLEKKYKQKPVDKIVEKARMEKQKVLLTETDSSANIDWDCRSLDDVKILLKCGLEFIRTIESDKQILADNRFGGCSFRIPTRYDKSIKQAKQKPIPKFRIGDKIWHKNYKGECIHHIIKIENNNYIGDDNTSISISTADKEYELVEKQGEQKPTIVPKFRIGDTIKNKKTNKIFTISDYSLLYEYYHDINHYHEIKFSEQDDWELVEQNPAWSEEELDSITAAINNLEYLKNNYVYHQIGLEPAITFLKSLKDRYTWKPSDEQMDALKKACDEHWEPDGLDPLYTLYQDLKKLREKLI